LFKQNICVCGLDLCKPKRKQIHNFNTLDDWRVANRRLLKTEVSKLPRKI